MNNKEKFIEIYKTCITREGADKFLEYLIEKTDFFTAPASTRFHGAYEGGLLDHSLNVYECLCDYIKHSRFCSKYGFSFSEESLAIVALLHDVCKTNFYKEDVRNVKIDGVWEQVPYYSIDDKLPYGHGEKSVYMISGFMKLTREEALAINWHMGGFDPRVQYGSQSMAQAYYQYPVCTLFHIADIQATYLDEKVE